MDTTSLVGSDLVILLLNAPTKVAHAQGRINGVTRLEKLLYLSSRESDLPRQVSEPLEFVPYNYGPFSKGVYEAVELLEEVDLLTEERAVDGKTMDNATEAGLGTGETEFVERRFVLTENGKLVGDLLGREHPDLVALFSNIKDRYGHLTLDQLVHYVYTKYPEDTVKSRIRDRYLPPNVR